MLDTTCCPAEHGGPSNSGMHCLQFSFNMQMSILMLAKRVLNAGGSKDKSHLGLLRSLLQRDLCTLDSVGLPTAHAQKAPVLGHGDGIALHVLHYAPGKAQVLQLLLCRLCVRDRRELNLLWRQGVCVLVQPPTCIEESGYCEACAGELIIGLCQRIFDLRTNNLARVMLKGP